MRPDLGHVHFLSRRRIPNDLGFSLTAVTPTRSCGTSESGWKWCIPAHRDSSSPVDKLVFSATIPSLLSAAIVQVRRSCGR